MFDEQPDDDPHGECRHYFRELEKERDGLRLKTEALEAAVLELSGRIAGAVKELEHLAWPHHVGGGYLYVVEIADVCRLLRSPNQP